MRKHAKKYILETVKARSVRNFKWHWARTEHTAIISPHKTSWNKFTNGYWLLRMSRLSALLSFLLSFSQASCPDSAAPVAHAEKFRLIVCCAPKEQLLSQGHIPSIPDSSKPFIPPPISCCASICICAGKHKYKGVETDLQSVITASTASNLKAICSCNKLFSWTHPCQKMMSALKCGELGLCGLAMAKTSICVGWRA